MGSSTNVIRAIRNFKSSINIFFTVVSHREEQKSQVLFTVAHSVPLEKSNPSALGITVLYEGINFAKRARVVLLFALSRPASTVSSCSSATPVAHKLNLKVKAVSGMRVSKVVESGHLTYKKETWYWDSLTGK